MAEACSILPQGPSRVVEIAGPATAWAQGLATRVAALAEGSPIIAFPDRRIVIPHADLADVDWRDALGPAGGRVVGVGHGWRVFRISGPAARTLLERGIEIDLDPRHFPVGLATATLCARVPVLLVAIEPDAFHLHAAASYSEWLYAWLIHVRAVLPPSPSPPVPSLSEPEPTP